ncbi:threonine-phosphate decarboxylase CobD [Microvirga rosea]|uniref:threonine-phosphate decarboxylase CobD n=1 Tax=Microvirga rosea TaxID=2715425 RepID=UPI001D0A9C6B|nr:threonine-phosphate decarboxylase CobD [Microvirga rosea]MCB8822285.1 threonine-phosphate decarboxylase CobD [Microvirga rosea]
MEHGGNLHDAKARFPEAPEPWIDLSTGINPRTYPAPPLDPEIFRRLPSPRQVQDLEGIAAASYGVAATSSIVAAPGSQALIGLLPRLRSPGRTAILGPTYAEHAHRWAREGHDVVQVRTLEEALGASADVVIAVNPNNPDGRIIPAAHLTQAAEQLAQRGGWLIIDEAFADLEDSVSVAGLSLPNTIILRSVGKAYGLAGLRLGFAVTWLQMAQEIRGSLGPWAVSGPALAIGAKALRDSAWLAGEQARLRTDALRLDELLKSAGFQVCGGTCLFRLGRHQTAPLRFHRLAHAGIWVRAFDFDPTILRFGIPKEKDWLRLRNALIN